MKGNTACWRDLSRDGMPRRAMPFPGIRYTTMMIHVGVSCAGGFARKWEEQGLDITEEYSWPYNPAGANVKRRVQRRFGNCTPSTN